MATEFLETMSMSSRIIKEQSFLSRVSKEQGFRFSSNRIFSKKQSFQAKLKQKTSYGQNPVVFKLLYKFQE